MPNEKYGDLIKEIEKIRDENSLKDYHAFVYWFIETSFVFKKEDILNSICDGTHDKGVDAVIIDNIEEKVKIIQSKFERAGNKTQFNEKDIKLLGGVRDYFKSRKSLESAMRKGNAVAKRLMNDAFDNIRNKHYSLQLIFITTHKNIPNIDELINEVMGFKTGEFSVYDYTEILWLLGEKMRDFTPPIGHYCLPYNDADKTLIRTSGYKSWVLTVSLDNICSLVNKYPNKLFRKNVRNFLGNSICNRGIQGTIENDPANFWYYNNGITILCDEANIVMERKYIRLVNPQVVNGCQTVISIKKFHRNLQGDVLVRIIEAKSHEFISALTLYQNSSNPVKKRDLKSNDPIQVRLKNEFRTQKYYYEIKRGEEFDKMKRKYPAMKQQYSNGTIKNGEVAKLLAAIKLNPGFAVSKGNEEFFGNSYEKLFDPDISTYDCLVSMVLYWWIKESYRGAKRFYDFDKSYVFKNPVTYYVLKLIYKILKKQNNWKKKVISFYENSNEKTHKRFLNQISGVISEYFKVIYRTWKDSGEPNHNTYCKKPSTINDIEKKRKEIKQLNEKSLYIFRKFILQ